MKKVRQNYFFDKNVILRLKAQALIKGVYIQDLANKILDENLPKKIVINRKSKLDSN